jgi:nitrate reductase NapE component
MSGEFTGLDRGKRKPAKRKGGFDAVVIVLALVVVVCGVGGVGYAVWLVTNTPQAKQEKIPTREEFRKRLLGMTTDQVLQAIGKPAAAEEAKGERLRMTWRYYRGMTVDPVSQTTDTAVFIDFEQGKVVEVRY